MSHFKAEFQHLTYYVHCCPLLKQISAVIKDQYDTLSLVYYKHWSQSLFIYTVFSTAHQVTSQPAVDELRVVDVLALRSAVRRPRGAAALRFGDSGRPRPSECFQRDLWDAGSKDVMQCWKRPLDGGKVMSNSRCQKPVPDSNWQPQHHNNNKWW